MNRKVYARVSFDIIVRVDEGHDMREVHEALEVMVKDHYDFLDVEDCQVTPDGFIVMDSK